MKAHFITASAALALGLTGGLTAAGYDARASSETSRTVHVDFDAPAGYVTSRLSVLQNAGGPRLDAVLLEEINQACANENGGVCPEPLEALEGDDAFDLSRDQLVISETVTQGSSGPEMHISISGKYRGNWIRQ